MYRYKLSITFSYSKAVYRNLGCDYEAHLYCNLGNFHVLNFKSHLKVRCKIFLVLKFGSHKFSYSSVCTKIYAHEIFPSVNWSVCRQISRGVKS